MVKQREKQRDEKDKYSVWKQHLPIMYDWILNHNLVWPSQSCRYDATAFLAKFLFRTHEIRMNEACLQPVRLVFSDFVADGDSTWTTSSTRGDRNCICRTG